MSIAEMRKRNPVATRASILGAAESLFVEKGFAAASMSDIARLASVTKSLIHHHFGSKEELWDEVKRQRMGHYAEVQRQLIDEKDDGEAGVLRRSIEAYFHFLQDNPEFVRLSSWMHLEDPRLSESTFPELVTLGVQRIEQEQAAGRIRDDVDAKHLVAMFVSLCTYWFMSHDSGFAHLMGTDAENADAAYLADLLKVYFFGVRPR